MEVYKYHVEPFSEDHTGRLSWGVLGNTLLRVAEHSAIRHGFGYDTMHRAGKAWVLSRLLIEMPRMPRMGEAYHVSTWVARIYRQFTDRLFTISDSNGQTLGHAISVWALIDINTRQPVNLSEYPNPGFHAAMDTGTVPLTGFTRSKTAPDAPCRTLNIVPSDLDINGHVNSIRYLQMATDSIYNIYGLDINASRPRRVEMTYVAETFYGDSLTVQAEAKADGEYHALLTRSDGTTAARAVAFFN